jgi:hypothetical protein
MPNAVLDYSSHENLSTGLRVEIDGPVTRVYLARGSRWPAILFATLCFLGAAEDVGALVMFLHWFGRPLFANPDGRHLVRTFALGGTMMLAAGIAILLWSRKWRRTSTILEASPEGLAFFRPVVWRFGRRFYPQTRITRIESKHARSAIRGLPDRMDLLVTLSRGWPPRWNLRTRSLEEAQRARDALAKALGLP